MEERERENDARRRRRGPLLPMPEQWTDRPRLSPAEQVLFAEFTQFAAFCGGDPRPTDALAWFRMRAVAPAEQEWLAVVFADLSAVVRERVKGVGSDG